ncbi:MAG: Lrp/AsnC family transcriptional regulator [Chloroflexi bacterium]|nr:Lrp/AsnC family transcriptional regulator [Chloroflexota bacterium]
MVKGFVLVNAQIGKAPEVAAVMRHIPEVLSADVVIGPYDVVAVVEVSETKFLNIVVNQQIHSIPGVKHTMTLLSIED